MRKCFPCHEYGAQSEAELVAGGYAVLGSPEDSKLYNRLIGSVGAGGPKDMPNNGALSNDEVATIRRWLEDPTTGTTSASETGTVEADDIH